MDLHHVIIVLGLVPPEVIMSDRLLYQHFAFFCKEKSRLLSSSIQLRGFLFGVTTGDG